MRREFSAGKFSIYVAEPSPSWVTIKHDNSRQSVRFHPNEARDLLYCLQRALEVLEELSEEV